jgi:putative exosortase-associated protein (TIGR04073 family)
MKFNKTILLALLASIFFSFSSISYADDAGTPEITHTDEADTREITEDTYGSKIGQKTLRALANISLGVIEIPKNIIIVSNRTNLLYGLTGGTGLGILNSAGRIAVGLLDLLTFPLPTQPIAQPVYPWNRYLDNYTNYNDMFVMDYQSESLARERDQVNMHQY